jgi:hypothetical protein
MAEFYQIYFVVQLLSADVSQVTADVGGFRQTAALARGVGYPMSAEIRSGRVVMGPTVGMCVTQVEDSPCHREEDPGHHRERYREATSLRSDRSKNWKHRCNSRKHHEPDDKPSISVPCRNGARTGYRSRVAGGYARPQQRRSARFVDALFRRLPASR